MTWPAWLRLTPSATRCNLLGPDLRAEVVIHVAEDWSRKVYVSKLVGTPQDLARVVESIVRAGVDLGTQHGIKIEFSPTPPPQEPKP